MSKVFIIGGGAAGMLAGVICGRMGNEVVIFEKNEKLGKKLFITGKGRCNVTNASDMEEVFSNIITNRKFMYSSLYSFDNQSVMTFFEELGIPLKIERGNRVFPISDHSSDIIKALQYELRRLDVTVLFQTNVGEILVKDGQAKGVVTADGKRHYADKVLLAAGGVSYPLTGSTGDGHKMASEAGHEITPLYPALVPLYVKEEWCPKLQGLSLKNIAIDIKQGKKSLYKEFGEMLFTHYGVSGPLIISASSYLTKKLANVDDMKEPIVLYLDLKPALTEKQLDARLIREFELNHNKQFKNSIGSLFPAKLIPVMIELSGISPEKKCGEISKEERKIFLDIIKNLKMTITKTADFREAIITQGGIKVKEVNPSTMESKIIKDLYFAGEILDVDALTGGYNLQIAWSSAYLAAVSMSEV